MLTRTNSNSVPYIFEFPRMMSFRQGKNASLRGSLSLSSRVRGEPIYPTGTDLMAEEEIESGI